MGPLTNANHGSTTDAGIGGALKQAAERSAVGIAVVCVVDGAPKIEWVNAAACRLFGRTSEELVGESPLRYVDQE